MIRPTCATVVGRLSAPGSDVNVQEHGRCSDLRELPLHVRFLPNESTGSYVTRLAERNGLSVGYLLEIVGEGKSRVVAPHLTELYLNRPAAERLARLAGRPLPVLQRALASLGEEYLLTGSGEHPVWKWPWAVTDGYLVRACALCAARRGVTEPAWLMVPDTWSVCGEHARWTDNSRDTAWPWTDLRPWPQVLDAHRRLACLGRRMGKVGRALMADAFSMMADRQVRSLYGRAPRWFAEAADRLGERRAAPFLAYPEAVRVARVLARSERHRLAGALTWEEYRRWHAQAVAELGPAFSPVLTVWMARHQPQTSVAARKAGVRPPLAAPHKVVGALASVAQLSCLPGELGAGTFDRPYL
nr:TniQ family protein [Kitasatospora sp. SID7827]